MRTILYLIMFSIASSVMSKDVQSELLRKNFIQKIDSRLIEFQKRLSPVDSNYIIRPQGTWTFKIRYNLSGNHIKTKGYSTKEHFTSEVESDIRHTTSFSATYRGITLGLAINPARITGKKHDFEININSYGNKYGFDYVYQNASTFHGKVVAPSGNISISTGTVKLRGVATSAYYVFNGKKFSLPAAFTQSYIQKHSAGSFFLGATYHGSSLFINNPAPSSNDIKRIRTSHAGINIGYGYNFVPPHNWLIHISLQPTIVLYSNNKLYYYGEDVKKTNDWSDILFTGRLAIIHYFNKRYFGGITYNYNHSKTGDADNLSISNSRWFGRLIFGVRL